MIMFLVGNQYLPLIIHVTYNITQLRKEQTKNRIYLLFPRVHQIDVITKILFH